MEKQETNLILCACSDPEHNILYTKIEEDKEVWLHILLSKRKWYERIWVGIKYIFGYTSKYGMYGEILINSSNSQPFLDIYNFVNKK